MPDTSDLPYLIRLLDDDDPAVFPVVSERLAEFGGDISQDLAALGLEMTPSGKKRLSSLLAKGRRETLRREWQVPTRGVTAWEDDWESFEHALRLLSDFLHDGITLRPALPDSLDLLADEIREDIPAPTANELRHWLFSKGKFLGERRNADACQCFDLCEVIDTQRGNATSLACLFMLLGRRLEAQVEGCNYPGHFLARIQIEGKASLIDCFHRGREFDVETLLHAHPEISERARAAVLSPAHLGQVLHRYVAEIRSSLAGSGRDEDAEFFTQLVATLEQ